MIRYCKVLRLILIIDTPSHLESKTCFGDNIEDEWFIAYLVFKLTEVHNGLIVQIEDNDGDFLLIEAADFLPIWANPETTRNRVSYSILQQRYRDKKKNLLV